LRSRRATLDAGHFDVQPCHHPINLTLTLNLKLGDPLASRPMRLKTLHVHPPTPSRLVRSGTSDGQPKGGLWPRRPWCDRCAADVSATGRRDRGTSWIDAAGELEGGFEPSFVDPAHGMFLTDEGEWEVAHPARDWPNGLLYHLSRDFYSRVVVVGVSTLRSDSVLGQCDRQST
jgi:hypothetical protein